MFGKLAVSRNALSCAQQHQYQAHFCGACHLMAEFGGRTASLATNYDLTFLTLVVSSLAGPLRIERRP